MTANYLILNIVLMTIILVYAAYCRYWVFKHNKQIAGVLKHPALPLIHKKISIYLSWFGALAALVVISMCTLLNTTLNTLQCQGLGAIIAVVLYGGFTGLNIVLKGYYDSVLTMQRNYR